MKEKFSSQFFFAYRRVSTQKQGVEGVSLEAQERILREYAKRRHSAHWYTCNERMRFRRLPLWMVLGHWHSGHGGPSFVFLAG